MSKKILLVDDDKEIVTLMQKSIKAAGFQVAVAQNAKSAMEVVEEGNVDLLVLDIMMPGLDGTKLCWVLKEGTKYQDIPIIIVSGKAKQDVKKLANEVGAEAYIPKPFEPQELLSKINELV